jgi:hypothetical protein
MEHALSCLRCFDVVACTPHTYMYNASLNGFVPPGCVARGSKESQRYRATFRHHSSSMQVDTMSLSKSHTRDKRECTVQKFQVMLHLRKKGSH